MQQAKGFVTRHFEAIVVLVLVAATAFAVLVAVDKLAFLNFFYIPALTAAYFLGKRQGVMVAIAAVLMVSVYGILNPNVFAPTEQATPAFGLFLWAAFLVITAYLVGTLYEAKERTATELRHAYEGILGLLATLIDAVDKHAEDHSVRVAEVATRICVVLDLPTARIDDIHVAGLLHEVGKSESSLATLRRAAEFGGPDERRGKPRPADPAGTILAQVVELVEGIGEHFDGSGPRTLAGETIPLGSRVLAAADEYESRITPKPFGAGLTTAEALVEVEALSGSRLDPVVVAALITAVEFD